MLEAPDRRVALGVAEAVPVDLLVMDGPRALNVERELIANLGGGAPIRRLAVLTRRPVPVDAYPVAAVDSFNAVRPW